MQKSLTYRIQKYGFLFTMGVCIVMIVYLLVFQVLSFYRTYQVSEGEYLGEPSVLWYLFMLVLGMVLVVTGTVYKEGGYSGNP